MTTKYVKTRYEGIYKHPDLDVYRVRVYDPRTGRMYPSTGTQHGIQAAKREQARLKTEVQRDGTPRAGKAPTVEEFGEAWRATLSVDPSTAADIEATLRLHVYPFFAGRRVNRVDRVTHTLAAQFVKELREGRLAVSTQGRIDTRVRALFEGVVAEGYRDFSPFKRVPRLAVPRQANRRQGEYVPSLGEALFLADVAADEGRLDVWAFIRIAAGTGLRAGELLGLSVDELDYPNPTWIDLRHQLQNQASLGGFYLKLPKSQERHNVGSRRIPLASWVADTLAVFSASRRPLRVTLPWVERTVVRGERTATLLLPSAYGQPVNESVPARAVRTLAARVGMPGRVTPHSLRRTYTTILGDGTVPLRARDYVTGHASSGMTEGAYTEVTPGALAGVRAATEDAFTAARGGRSEGVSVTGS